MSAATACPLRQYNTTSCPFNTCYNNGHISAIQTKPHSTADTNQIGFRDAQHQSMTLCVRCKFYLTHDRICSLCDFPTDIVPWDFTTKTPCVITTNVPEYKLQCTTTIGDTLCPILSSVIYDMTSTLSTCFTKHQNKATMLFMPHHPWLCSTLIEAVRSF